ncbi:hypothetical protein ALI144C_30935 [Actinosynnema sp. ALI-1.44]|nr:hypothetical protein ALI144C_30935 [Actinosynnema sp. ALI-1.44]
MPFGWVTGDEAYGVDTKLRMWLESEDIAHVLAVLWRRMILWQITNYHHALDREADIRRARTTLRTEFGPAYNNRDVSAAAGRFAHAELVPTRSPPATPGPLSSLRTRGWPPWDAALCAT